MSKMKLKLGKIEITSNTNILSIEVPKEMEKNIDTGMHAINRLFAGDGITPSTAALLTGMPGAGKTTIAMQLGDSLTGLGHKVLFNTAEESLYQIRRTAKRLALTNGFVVGQDRNVYHIIEHAEMLRKKAKKGQHTFLIHDSLQAMEVPRDKGKRGRGYSGGNMQLLAIERVTAWAKETYGIAIIIGQVTKSGDFAGKNEIKHTVDCHLHLGWEIDSNGVETPIAEMTKNRFGPGGLYYAYDLTETGIAFGRGSDIPKS